MKERHEDQPRLPLNARSVPGRGNQNRRHGKGLEAGNQLRTQSPQDLCVLPPPREVEEDVDGAARCTL
jgi:hypothetical protein